MISNRKMTIEEKYEDCCITLNFITKELEIYKKALKMACSADGMFWESEYNGYLQKAREE